MSPTSCSISAASQTQARAPGSPAGVDEAGRGSWAGPLVVAAVVLPADTPDSLLRELRDSKKIRPAKRFALAKLLKSTVPFGLDGVGSNFIDGYGIAEAERLCALQALHRLWGLIKFDTVVFDGNPEMWEGVAEPLARLDPSIVYECIEKADTKLKAVSAASIIAKADHDEVMLAYDKLFPQYGFAQHMGYGTEQHQKALETYGPTDIHRRSFRSLEPWVPWGERSGYRLRQYDQRMSRQQRRAAERKARKQR